MMIRILSTTNSDSIYSYNYSKLSICYTEYILILDTDSVIDPSSGRNPAAIQVYCSTHGLWNTKRNRIHQLLSNSNRISQKSAI